MGTLRFAHPTCFNDAPSSWLATPAGSFCIFFPEDAHAPLVSAGLIRKLVMKVAV